MWILKAYCRLKRRVFEYICRIFLMIFKQQRLLRPEGSWLSGTFSVNLFRNTKETCLVTGGVLIERINGGENI